MVINTKDVFGVSAEKVGNLMTKLYGKDLRIEILEACVEELGVKKIAEAAGITQGAITNALRRRSFSDQLSRKIFTGLAKKYPHVLKFHLERILENYAELFPQIAGELAKRIEEMKKEI